MKIMAAARCASYLTFCMGSVGAWANSYTIVDLGKNIYPTAIDSKGEISATLKEGDYHHRRERAMVYSGGKWRQESPHHKTTLAAGISKGRVAGNIADAPVTWVHHGEPMRLGLPGQYPYGTATAIDAAGDVSGTYGPSNQNCFLWMSSTGASQDLGFLGEGDKCETGGMDSRGRIFGRSTEAPDSYEWHAFVWRDQHMHKLHMPPHGTSAMALSGNKAGDVVGWANVFYRDYGDAVESAIVWHDGVPHNLAPTSGWRTKANAVDDAGTIVGWGFEPGGDDPNYEAMRFDGKGFTYLGREVVNPDGWDGLYDATGISPSGVIVGFGRRSDGKVHGFMLKPL